MKIGNKDVAGIDIDGKELGLYEDFQNLVDKKLTSISAAMLDGCAKIGAYAFIAQYLLMSCEIPNSVTSLEVSSFQTCIALTNIDIPASVANMAAGNVFRGCTALADVIIRSPSLSAFGNGVFYDDANLKDLWLYATDVPRIGNVTTGNASETFGGTWSSGTHTLHVPAGAVANYNSGIGNYEWSKYFGNIHGFLQEGGNARYVLYYDLPDTEAENGKLLMFNIYDTNFPPYVGVADTISIKVENGLIVVIFEKNPSKNTSVSISNTAPTTIDIASMISDLPGSIEITELTDAGKEHLYTLS